MAIEFIDEKETKETQRPTETTKSTGGVEFIEDEPKVIRGQPSPLTFGERGKLSLIPVGEEEKRTQFLQSLQKGTPVVMHSGKFGLSTGKGIVPIDPPEIQGGSEFLKDIGDILGAILPTAGHVTGAILGAGVAVVGGQLGPQIATPEELITVPAAAAVGAGIGRGTGQAGTDLIAKVLGVNQSNLREESQSISDAIGEGIISEALFRGVGAGIKGLKNIPLAKRLIKNVNKFGRNFVEGTLRFFGRINERFTENMVRGNIRTNVDRIMTSENRSKDAMLIFGRGVKKEFTEIRTRLGNKLGETRKALIKKNPKTDISSTKKWMEEQLRTELNILDDFGNVLPDRNIGVDTMKKRVTRLHDSVVRLPKKASSKELFGIMDDIGTITRDVKINKIASATKEDAFLFGFDKRIRDVIKSSGDDVRIPYREISDRFAVVANSTDDFEKLFGGVKRFKGEIVSSLKSDAPIPRSIANTFENPLIEEFMKKIESIMVKEGGAPFNKKMLDLVTAQTFGNKEFQALKSGIIAAGLSKLGVPKELSTAFALTASNPRLSASVISNIGNLQNAVNASKSSIARFLTTAGPALSADALSDTIRDLRTGKKLEEAVQ